MYTPAAGVQTAHQRPTGCVLIDNVGLQQLVETAGAYLVPNPEADPRHCWCCILDSRGFAAFVDPGTGQPFRNQGQCVSFVARGGMLVPVAPLPDLTVSKSCSPTTIARDGR